MDAKYLTALGAEIKSKLPDNHGFILFVVPFGESPGNFLRYISDCKREDAINALKEWLIKCGGGEDWMRHIK